MPLKGRIVYVEWIDAAGNDRWGDVDERRKTKPLRCHTVGVLLARDRDGVRVTSSWCDDNDTVADTTVIPNGCVKRIRTVATVRPKRTKR